METHLASFIKGTADGNEAEAILRKCVHCGFCNATCPTYQLLGDELDGPRGRIYLMKQMLEGAPVTRKTQEHLDRCLTCRNCESTCPSGVRYGRLVDIGRKVADERLPAARSLPQRLLRDVLREGLTRRRLFTPALRLGQAFRPLLPGSIKKKVPPRQASGVWPKATHTRRMLLQEGCVQPALMPNIDAATARVLDAVGVQLIVASKTGCCGAIRQHTDDHDGAIDDMRRNIDAWWPHIHKGAEAIVINASGCGSMVKEYGHHLRHDPMYAAKAERVSALARDLSEILPDFAAQLLPKLKQPNSGRVAWHPPCSLQHGQQIRGKVEALLSAAGVDVQLCADAHLCCGSAGTYSILQPELATRLRDAKLANLRALEPAQIVSANIGCVLHLQSGTRAPVRHWIELLDDLLVRE